MLSIKSRFGDDIQKAIQAMLTPGVGLQALSTSIGTLTVTDTPDVLDRIGRYIDDVNARMSRKAMLYVTVASVTITDADSQGIDWNVIWKSLSGNYGVNLVSAFSPLEGSSTAGFGILDSATGNASQFAGTQAILNALSRQGSVTIMRQRGVTTQHLQPTPIHLTNEEQYVCGRSQTNTAQVPTHYDWSTIRAYGEQIAPQGLDHVHAVLYAFLEEQSDPMAESVMRTTVNSLWDGCGEWHG